MPVQDLISPARARREDARRARRREIQDAARALITSTPGGVTRVKVEDIAHAAGCSIGSIYIHFQSKQDLLTSMLDPDTREIDEAQWSALLGLASATRESISREHAEAAEDFLRCQRARIAAEFCRRLDAAIASELGSPSR